uniref:Agglutination/immobilization antigen n=1 Tax=Cryptocaryon irritans TaxID=153251 RepID=C7SF38_9CILI|nr:agglutination/immobilization antigen precursor [Cryptocaryon irritans]AEH21941.1 agglutination/immobilization antigen-like protein [Cryptocaryon irritans]
MQKILAILLISSLAVISSAAWAEKTAVADWKGTFVVTKSSCLATCGWKIGSTIVIAEKTGDNTKVTWVGTVHTTDATNVDVASGSCKYVSVVAAAGTPGTAAEVLKNDDECVFATGMCTIMGQKQTKPAKITFNRDTTLDTKPLQVLYKQFEMVQKSSTTQKAAATDQAADCDTQASMVDTTTDAKAIVGTLKLSKAVCNKCSWDTTKDLKITQDATNKYMVTLAGTLKETATGDCKDKLTASEKCYVTKKDDKTYILVSCTTLDTTNSGIPIVIATVSSKTTLTMTWTDSGSNACSVVGEVTSTSGSISLKMFTGFSAMLILAFALLFK